MEYKGTTAEENEGLQKKLVCLAKKSRFKRKLISAVAIFAVVLVAVTASWLYGRNQAIIARLIQADPAVGSNYAIEFVVTQ